MSIADLQADQQPIEIQALQSQFNKIKESLIKETPGLPDALAEMHLNLLKHEELVHLLDDDDIALLHKAHEKHKQFALVQKEEKALKKGGKSKKLTENDLGNL